MSRGLPSSVLFCCTHNSIRSPMAEALLKRHSGDRIFVDSCGVDQAYEIDGFTYAVMREWDIDMSNHYPKVLEDANGESFEMVIALSPPSLRRALELTRNNSIQVLSWQTADPSWMEGSRDEKISAYRRVRDMLDKRIASFFQL